MTEHTTLPVGDVAAAASPAGGTPDLTRGRTGSRLTWRERRSRWDVKVSPYLYISPFFVLFVIIGLFPLGYTAYLSLYDWQPLASHKGEFLGLENYSKVLGDPVFFRALVNTISIFLLSSVPQVVIAVVVAALLDNQLRGRTLWRMSVLLPFVAAPAATALIFSSLFADKSGIVNEVLGWVGVGPVGWHVHRLPSHLAIATMVNWRWTGYNALIFLAAMQAVPRDLYESSALDGASRVRQFRSITLPMIRPTMIFVIVTSTIGGLQIFTEPRMFDESLRRNGGADNQFTTLTLYIFNRGIDHGYYGQASAAAWLLFLLIIAIALLNFAVTRLVSRRGQA